MCSVSTHALIQIQCVQVVRLNWNHLYVCVCDGFLIHICLLTKTTTKDCVKTTTLHKGHSIFAEKILVQQCLPRKYMFKVEHTFFFIDPCSHGLVFQNNSATLLILSFKDPSLLLLPCHRHSGLQSPVIQSKIFVLESWSLCCSCQVDNSHQRKPIQASSPNHFLRWTQGLVSVKLQCERCD